MEGQKKGGPKAAKGDEEKRRRVPKPSACISLLWRGILGLSKPISAAAASVTIKQKRRIRR